MSRSTELRRRMVEVLERNGSVRTPAIRSAFLSVQREIFVSHIAARQGLDRVYADDALVTRELGGLPTSSSSQPTIMAMMLEALDIREGQRVLEIGLGTGYNAAILRTLVGRDGGVTSIDIDPDVVAAARESLATAGMAVETVVGDGTAGFSGSGPYDRIIATASIDHIPLAWWEQLTPGGIVVAPLRFGAMQLVVVLARTPTGFVSTQVIRGGFMPMRPGPDAPSSSGMSITVDSNLGDGSSSWLSISGPGLAALSPDARGVAVGRLLATPRLQSIGDGPAVAYPVDSVLWQAVMSIDVDEQIFVYSHGSRTRFGTIDATGAAALMRIGRHGEADVLEEIELYGPADAQGRRLAAAAADWVAAGRPRTDQLAIAIDYAEAAAPASSTEDRSTSLPARPAWGLVSQFSHGQRRTMGWYLSQS